jgi:hypothetical protein
LGQF